MDEFDYSDAVEVESTIADELAMEHDDWIAMMLK